MSRPSLAPEDAINAQIDILLSTYGIAGRMAHVTADDVREVFQMVLMEYPAEAVEAAVQLIIKGNWLEHQSDLLPSTAVVAHATRSQMSMASSTSQMRH